MKSVFNPSSSDARYTSLWISLLDNYMHEYSRIADDWVQFRRALSKYSEGKKATLIRQFVERNVAEKFISVYGSGDVSATEIIPKESLDGFCEILVDRLDPETLQYV